MDIRVHIALVLPTWSSWTNIVSLDYTYFWAGSQLVSFSIIGTFVRITFFLVYFLGMGYISGDFVTISLSCDCYMGLSITLYRSGLKFVASLFSFVSELEHNHRFEYHSFFHFFCGQHILYFVSSLFSHFLELSYLSEQFSSSLSMVFFSFTVRWTRVLIAVLLWYNVVQCVWYSKRKRFKSGFRGRPSVCCL